MPKNNMVTRFADVDKYLCLDPIDVEKKINPKTRAVIFVGYGGRVGQLDKIIEICKKHQLKLILDAAHMSGTKVNGVCPGTWDGVDVTVYSYQAVKNLPTADSGMICFADERLDKIARKLGWLGINKDTYTRTGDMGTYKWNYDVEYVGQKDHGNSIMAAIALVQLKYLDEENIYRRKLVDIYDKAFSDNKKITIISAPYKDECSYHIYELAVPDREGLMAKLAQDEIYCGVHYRDNTEYSMYSYDHGTCPKAHEISQHLITIPLHLYLTEDDVITIARKVNEYIG
jgi:dTDP-4-amino-4,6-dideoxygalactose transaminase